MHSRVINKGSNRKLVSEMFGSIGLEVQGEDNAMLRNPNQSTRIYSLAGMLLFATTLANTFPAARAQELVLDRGIDTLLAAGGLNGPDGTHGEQGENPDNVERWEWDGSDGGGENHGMLWFEIDPAILDAFGENSVATLQLHVDNTGDSGDLHRMTVDWLSGPDGGNDVTWNNVPSGPGVVPGSNAEASSNASTGFLDGGTTVDVDVSADLLAWGQGSPNYGWGITPTGGNGTGITSFESETNPGPRLILSNVVFQGADFNEDGATDLADYEILKSNFISGTTFAEGDLNFSGTVDLQDFADFVGIFNDTAGAAAVPEPSTICMFCSALLALFLGRPFSFAARRS